MNKQQIIRAVRAALDECESCCLDDRDDRQRLERALFSRLVRPPALRACEACGGSGPVLYDEGQNRYVCRSCHSRQNDCSWQALFGRRANR